MPDLVKSPREELIEALEFLSDEDKIYEYWFIRGTSIDEDFDFVFDCPHIDWNSVAPDAAESTQYKALRQAFDAVVDDRFRLDGYNGHLSADLVHQSGLWRAIPAAAKALTKLVLLESRT